jgi:hypothetical protein
MTPFWPYGEHLEVRAERGLPTSFVWRGRRHQIAAIHGRWRVHTGWWRESEVRRDYWQATTDSGLMVLVFHDLARDEWRLERIWE